MTTNATVPPVASAANPANGAPPAPSPPSPGEVPPAGSAADATKKPEEGKGAAIIRQREKALEDQRRAFARERDQHTQLQRQLQTEREKFARDQSEFRAEVDRAIAQARGGKPAERQAEQSAPWKQELESLRGELKAERDARTAREFEAAKDRELSKFVEEARGGKEKWPLSAKFSEKKLRTMAWQIAAESARAGTPLDNAEVLDRIEEELAEIAALREERSTQAESTAANGKSGGTETSPPATTKPAPTLTSARSGEAGDPPPRATLRQQLSQSRDDQIRDAINAVKAAREKLAADRAASRKT
jgi:hypothetical protein